MFVIMFVTHAIHSLLAKSSTKCPCSKRSLSLKVMRKKRPVLGSPGNFPHALFPV